MRTKNRLLLSVMVWISLPGNICTSQTFLPSPQFAPDKPDFAAFDISKADTNWLYRSYKLYYWEDAQYKPWETYVYYSYNNQLVPDKPDRIYIIDSFTDDSLMYSQYVYDTAKRIAKQINCEFNTITNSWDYADQWFYWYDGMGNDTSSLWQVWHKVNDQWINKEQIKHEFDNKNYLLEEKRLKWVTSGEYWKTESGYKYEYVLNDQGCPDTLIKNEWNAGENSWGNYIRKYWIYDENNVPTEYTYDIWEPALDKYVYYQRFFNLTYKDWPGCDNLDHTYNPTTLALNQQNWLGEWIDILEYNAVYDEFDGYEFIIRRFDYEWANSERREVRFYPDGRLIFKNKEVWKNDQWTLERADTSEYVFDNGKLVEHFINIADTANSNQWTPFRKIVLDDHIWYSGIHDQGSNVGNITHIQLNPNPATGQLTIKLSEKGHRINSVDILDQSGRKVLSAKSDSNNDFIETDISKLSTGVYIVLVESTEGRLYRSKLVKQ